MAVRDGVNCLPPAHVRASTTPQLTGKQAALGEGKRASKLKEEAGGRRVCEGGGRGEEGGNRKSKGGGHLLLPPAPPLSFFRSPRPPHPPLSPSKPPHHLFFFSLFFLFFVFSVFLFFCFSFFLFLFFLFFLREDGWEGAEAEGRRGCAQHLPFRSPPHPLVFDAPLPSHFEASPIEAPLVFEAHLSFFFFFFLFPSSVFFVFFFSVFSFFLFFLLGGVNISTA